MLAIANAAGDRSSVVQGEQMPAFVVNGGGMTMVRVELPARDCPVVEIDSPTHSLHVREDLAVTC